ncbi:DUF2690 domain-containing protein [Sphaerisporangium aureirubrum]|uniref:DUF2690 domain-containing protein n=1 Tax=Sphaerisporangium aureirubrum TaxID=1544736 RepID=A0ABW1NWM4_9ACTN
MMRTTMWGHRPLLARLGAAVVAAVACGAALAMPAHATAAVSCYGDFCSGQDPQATGCAADAVTVATDKVYAAEIYLDLRWSPTCKTNWARLRGVSGTINNFKVVQPATNYSRIRSGTNWWTYMIYSPNLCTYAYVELGAYGGTLQTSCV